MKIDKLVMRTAIVVGLMLIFGVTYAGITATVVPGPSVLHPGDGTASVNYTGPTSSAQCDQAAKKIIGKSTCSDVRYITGVADCTDEKAPKLYLAKVKIEGSEYLELPGASFTEDTYTEMADLYVHTAAWPAGYPNCWVRGVAPRAEWRLNTKDEPGKAFMERRDPSMPPGDLIADELDSVEPVCWPGDDCTQVPV